MTSYWIQNSDFTTIVDEPLKSPMQVIDAFKSHNWEEQIEQQKRLELDNRDACPAGLGVVRETGVILHVIPNPDGTIWGHWHYRKGKKTLGFIPSTQSHVRTFKSLPSNELPNIITRFINGDDNWLANHLLKED